MNKFLLALCFVCFSLSAQALSIDAQKLKDKLATFNYINADFIQRITSTEGKILNESTGEVTISRPGKFHWQVKTPEEELIVSNGETIWYYSPFIEQVTLINFDETISDTPFALLAGATESQWENYIVEHNADLFTVTNPKQVQATTFIFEFAKTGKIAKFVVIDALGQRSEFELIHKSIVEMADDSLYDFNIPTGVEVDDQR